MLAVKYIITQIIFLLVITSIYCYNFPPNGTKIETPGFPQIYKDCLSNSWSFEVNENQGIAIAFEQFLAAPVDCVFMCSEDSSVPCSSLCGDAMDHGLVPKIMKVNGSATVKMITTDCSNNQKINTYHSGISGKTFVYDINNPTFFECGDSVTLSTNETYYFISQNYPQSITHNFENCVIQFIAPKSRSGIRFAVYDFLSGTQDDSFVIRNENTTINLSGFETEDEPVPLYFSNSATVTFSFSVASSSFIKKRFYILVNSFEEVPKKSTSCLNIGNSGIPIGGSVTFGPPKFEKDIYENNLNCIYNFTRPDDGINTSVFGLAIKYESEKCCDTLSIDGLSEYFEVYQGYQNANMFFTNSRAIHFSFQSDGIVSGLGFEATIQNIDCRCPEDIHLTQETTQTLTSPGYADSMTYCPNILCQTKIFFDDQITELNLNFKQVNLRSSVFNNQSDYLKLFDAYENNFIYVTSFMSQQRHALQTVSPILVEFVSYYQNSFPLSESGIGFEILLELKTKNYINEKIVFENGYFMKDISDLDFTSNVTYQFNIKARSGHKVSIYLLTEIFQRGDTLVHFDVYDGDSPNSKLLSNKLEYNLKENGYSYKIQSSGENVVINVRNPLQNNFQILVTDIEQDSECGSLVYSLSTTESSEVILLHGPNCLKVLHFVEQFSGYYNSFMHLNFAKIANIQTFIGVGTKYDRLLANSTMNPVLNEIFSSFVTLQYSTSDVVELTFDWNFAGPIYHTMNANDTVVLMTPDYLKNTTTQVSQTTSLQLKGESNIQTGIRVEFLADVGAATGYIQWSSDFKGSHVEKINAVKKGQVFENCGEKIYVDYSSEKGVGNGIYAHISRAQLRCSGCSYNFLSTLMGFFFVYLFF